MNIGRVEHNFKPNWLYRIAFIVNFKVVQS